jgi:hypothetical protein
VDRQTDAIDRKLPLKLLRGFFLEAKDAAGSTSITPEHFFGRWEDANANDRLFDHR